MLGEKENNWINNLQGSWKKMELEEFLDVLEIQPHNIIFPFKEDERGRSFPFSIGRYNSVDDRMLSLAEIFHAIVTDSRDNFYKSYSEIGQRSDERTMKRIRYVVFYHAFKMGCTNIIIECLDLGVNLNHKTGEEGGEGDRKTFKGLIVEPENHLVLIYQAIKAKKYHVVRKVLKAYYHVTLGADILENNFQRLLAIGESDDVNNLNDWYHKWGERDRPLQRVLLSVIFTHAIEKRKYNIILRCLELNDELILPDSLILLLNSDDLIHKAIAEHNVYALCNLCSILFDPQHYKVEENAVNDLLNAIDNDNAAAFSEAYLLGFPVDENFAANLLSAVFFYALSKGKNNIVQKCLELGLGLEHQCLNEFKVWEHIIASNNNELLLMLFKHARREGKIKIAFDCLDKNMDLWNKIDDTLFSGESDFYSYLLYLLFQEAVEQNEYRNILSNLLGVRDLVKVFDDLFRGFASDDIELFSSSYNSLYNSAVNPPKCKLNGLLGVIFSHAIVKRKVDIIIGCINFLAASGSLNPSEGLGEAFSNDALLYSAMENNSPVALGYLLERQGDNPDSLASFIENVKEDNRPLFHQSFRGLNLSVGIAKKLLGVVLSYAVINDKMDIAYSCIVDLGLGFFHEYTNRKTVSDLFLEKGGVFLKLIAISLTQENQEEFNLLISKFFNIEASYAGLNKLYPKFLHRGVNKETLSNLLLEDLFKSYEIFSQLIAISMEKNNQRVFIFLISNFLGVEGLSDELHKLYLGLHFDYISFYNAGYEQLKLKVNPILLEDLLYRVLYYSMEHGKKKPMLHYLELKKVGGGGNTANLLYDIARVAVREGNKGIVVKYIELYSTAEDNDRKRQILDLLKGGRGDLSLEKLFKWARTEQHILAVIILLDEIYKVDISLAKEIYNDNEIANDTICYGLKELVKAIDTLMKLQGDADIIRNIKSKMLQIVSHLEAGLFRESQECFDNLQQLEQQLGVEAISIDFGCFIAEYYKFNLSREEMPALLSPDSSPEGHSVSEVNSLASDGESQDFLLEQSFSVSEQNNIAPSAASAAINAVISAGGQANVAGARPAAKNAAKESMNPDPTGKSF
jgi:hypothetical protein